MNKFEWLRERYLAGYITEEQLARYVSLGAITEKQAMAIHTELSDRTAPADSQAEKGTAGMNQPTHEAKKNGFWNRIKQVVRA